jgi:DNA gyrase inhibitor GyrI
MYAITLHFGSHEEIGLTWDRWRKEWLPVSGWRHDPSRPSLEWYQNDAATAPELLLTFLCDPVVRD